MIDQNSGIGRHADRSAEAYFVNTIVQRLSELPPVRKDLVERIKEEIRQGVYETPEKVDIAIERLAKDLS